MNTQNRKTHLHNYGSYQQPCNMGLVFQSQLSEVVGSSTKPSPGSSSTSSIISSQSPDEVSLFYATDENCNEYVQGHSDTDGLPTCSQVSSDHISTVPLHRSFNQDSKVDNFDLQSAVKFHLQNSQNFDSSKKVYKNSYWNFSYMNKSTEEAFLKQRQRYVSFSDPQNHRVSFSRFSFNHFCFMQVINMVPNTLANSFSCFQINYQAFNCQLLKPSSLYGTSSGTHSGLDPARPRITHKTRIRWTQDFHSWFVQSVEWLRDVESKIYIIL